MLDCIIFILDAVNSKVSSALSSRDFPRGYLINLVLLNTSLPPLQISRQCGGCAKPGEFRHHMRDSLPRSTCMEQAARLRDSNSCRCMISAVIFRVFSLQRSTCSQRAQKLIDCSTIGSLQCCCEWSFLRESLRLPAHVHAEGPRVKLPHPW